MATAPRPRSSRTRKTPRYEPVLELPPLPPEQHEALRCNIALHGVLVPILVDGDGPVRGIIDGNRRKGIADELGYDCPEVVKDGLSDQEKRTLARALNLARRQLDQAGKRSIIADQLRETPGRSNRWVGKQLGVHHATVAAVRADMEGTGQIIQCATRLGADNRTQPAHKPDIGIEADRRNGHAHESGEPAGLADRDASIILADFDEKSILRAALEIRQGRVAERVRRQKEHEEQARLRLGGQRTWAVTGDQEVVPCDLLVCDPPFGITREPWEPADVEGFTRKWCDRWSGCGADFVAVFWCQGRLWEGRRWFDGSLSGYEFQQLLAWHASNHCGPRGHHSLKQSWYPIFLYRRKRSGRKVIGGDKLWDRERHVLDCHVAPVPETTYLGEDMRQHPCQKPVSVMRWLIHALSEPGELVASNFAGVAPCGVASVQLGRRYHGIETSPDYRRIAEARVAAYGHPK